MESERVVAAVGFMALTATAQAQTAAPQVSSQRITGTAAAPFVRRLDTIPQMTRREQHPQSLAPLTGVDMYFAGMFARSDGTWQTAIGRNSYNAINQP